MPCSISTRTDHDRRARSGAMASLSLLGSADGVGGVGGDITLSIFDRYTELSAESEFPARSAARGFFLRRPRRFANRAPTELLSTAAARSGVRTFSQSGLKTADRGARIAEPDLLPSSDMTEIVTASRCAFARTCWARRQRLARVCRRVTNNFAGVVILVGHVVLLAFEGFGR